MLDNDICICQILINQSADPVSIILTSLHSCSKAIETRRTEDLKKT